MATLTLNKTATKAKAKGKGKGKGKGAAAPADNFVDPILQPLLDIINADDPKAYEAYITTGSNRNLLLALTPSLRKKAQALGERASEDRKISGERQAPPPAGVPVLSKTALLYLGIAFDKMTSPMHPNFRKALAKRPKNLEMHEHIKTTAARMFDANKHSIKHAIVNTGRALTFDTQYYVTFYKGLITDACFAAHMDQLLLRKSASAEDLNEGMDSMLDGPPIDTKDAPLYDKSNAQRNAEQEAYEGGEAREPIASSIDDVHDAVARIQAWIGLSVTGMAIEQREYWGVDGLFPLTQRVDDDEMFGKVYTPIIDFDGFVEWQNESFQRKSRTVQVPLEVTDAMLS